MDCKEFNEMLDRYDELNDMEKEILNSHSEQCKECGDELKFMLSVEKTLKSLPKLEVKSDFIASLNARIDEFEKNDKIIPLSYTRARKLSQIGNMGNAFKRYSAVAACMLIAVVLGSNAEFIMDNLQNKTGCVINESVVITESDKREPKNEEIKSSPTPLADKKEQSSDINIPFLKDVSNKNTSSPSTFDTTVSDKDITNKKTDTQKASDSLSVFAKTKNQSTPKTYGAESNMDALKPQGITALSQNAAFSGNNGASAEQTKAEENDINQTAPAIQASAVQTQTPVQTTVPSVNNTSAENTNQTQTELSSENGTDTKTGRSVPEQYSIAMSAYNVSQDELPVISEKKYNYDEDTVESYTLAAADRSGMAIAYGDFSVDVSDDDEDSTHEYITVSEDGYEKASEIFSSHSDGTQDGGYVMSGSGLGRALGEMDEEGISYMTDISSYNEENIIVSVVSG